jgi:hypothetical protein
MLLSPPPRARAAQSEGPISQSKGSLLLRLRTLRWTHWSPRCWFATTSTRGPVRERGAVSRPLDGVSVASRVRAVKDDGGNALPARRLRLSWEEAAALVTATGLSKKEYKRQVREQQRLYAKAARAARARPPATNKPKREALPELNVSVVLDCRFGALMNDKETKKLGHQIRSEWSLLFPPSCLVEESGSFSPVSPKTTPNRLVRSAARR